MFVARGSRPLQARAGALALCLALSLLPAPACRAGIDHVVPYDDSGIWARTNQEVLLYGLIAGEVVGAVWAGGESRFGHTMWQSIDSSVGAGLAAWVLQIATSRVRPRDSPDPNLWFQGKPNTSFPSGEVTAVSSIITPPVLEYGHQYPLVYALELLPIYDAIARVKVQAHWQTDVIAGYALGTAFGIWAHGNPNPFILRVMPHAIYIGISKKF
ncbi:MAG TPA: phosphatase PAP2 family protein [Steroidobacteraceae bacterium]|nr:phosphatase PAP2 family protein [Steroidobacteraceae bacterium]